MAAAAGVEPATCSLGESRSIQLSYATASVSFAGRMDAMPVGQPMTRTKPSSGFIVLFGDGPTASNCLFCAVFERIYYSAVSVKIKR